ncbi:MAG: response regulator [Rickettsiales bacterium]|jgi:two-component system phosphate regulon response regulator OmpR|nr:response regulator [Rickettsiales bacterium]
MSGWHLLVIDDDNRLRSLLDKYLVKNGFFVSSTASVSEARELMKKYIFDLVVVDYLMPGEDGLSFISEARESGNKIPILMLTALNDVANRIEVLSCGADDYLPKPFEPKELVLRIMNILKRVNIEVAEYGKIYFGDFVFHSLENELYRNDILVKLTDAESKILTIFCNNANTVLSREQICNIFGGGVVERSIDVQITRLRRKIEDDVKSPKLIKTVRNSGYMFVPRN